MIQVTFYNNGFEINGHAEIGICSLVTCMSWTFASMIIQSYGTDDKNAPQYYTSSYDKSNAGYSYLTFDNSINRLNWIFNEFKYHMREWCEKEYTTTQITFDEINDLLLIPDNFKETRGIK